MKATVRLVLPPVILLTDDNRGDREVLLRLNCANYFPPSLEASYIGFGRMEPQLHRLQRHCQKGRDTIGFSRIFIASTTLPEGKRHHRLQPHGASTSLSYLSDLFINRPPEGESEYVWQCRLDV